MDTTEHTTVYVCIECGDKGEPQAPRSCVTCRVSMCEHLWEAGESWPTMKAVPPYTACNGHGLTKRYGIQLPI